MRLLIAVLLLIFLGLQMRLWTGEGSYADISRLNKEIARQSLENENLEQRNKVLYAEVDELKTGLDALEERARNELGMVKDGEIFYLLVE